ncbi:hypothetical protein B9G98_02521 [Wickerhamiella sorbophila]|uniref:2-dehydropantoate 2-reductase n=1 Tax=Wickerhamiella sorbophila TaxID=45607 RepID=A0A2T0FIS1_9ASCO|nr:hypothetical protein B9G98_02521 [Wickerhamiella sorbophila]PRT54901.1 hypothetical protein B9G98_02521 [Wickerhamiella sorbophila]
MKSVLVLGSGGVGAVTALALQSSGEADVTLIVRTDYETVMTRGYEFKSVDYGQVDGWRPSRVVKSVDEAVEHGPYDYIVVCTKFVPEVQKTEDMVRPFMHKGATVVLVQNGLGNEEPVMKAFPDGYVLGGVSMIGSTNYDGRINHISPDEVTIGTYDKRPEAIASAKEYVRLYSLSKSKGIFTEHLAKKRWIKLFYNATYNTIAAVTGLDTGRLYFSGISNNLVKEAMAEVRAIAEKELGEKLDPGIEAFMLNVDANEYYEPSMLVDVRKGQPMELEAILGNPLRLAQKHNIPAPLLQVVYIMLRGRQMALLEKRGLVDLPPLGFDLKEHKPVYDTLPWTE